MALRFWKCNYLVKMAKKKLRALGGGAMKETKGRVNSSLVNKLLKEILAEMK